MTRSTSTSWRGTLYPAITVRAWATTSSSDGVAPGRGCTTATTRSPHRSSGEAADDARSGRDRPQVVVEHGRLVVHDEPRAAALACRAGDHLPLAAGLRRAEAIDDDGGRESGDETLLDDGREDGAAREQQ